MDVRERDVAEATTNGERDLTTAGATLEGAVKGSETLSLLLIATLLKRPTRP
jgi:hypothetical protein